MHNIHTMKQVYILFLCILSSLALLGQSRKGSVFDADTKEPLSGATIKAQQLIFQSGGPLDLLPLFADIDKELIFSYPVETDLVKARPTFHYRLPNSMVDDPGWNIAADWNKWVEVERLAGDEARLSRMTDDFFATRGGNLLFVRSKWAAKTRDWLHV